MLPPVYEYPVAGSCVHCDLQLWPLMCRHEKSHPLQSSTLSDMHFKYPLQAQRCSLGLLESVTSMWVKTEPDLLNNIFFQMSSIDSLSSVSVGLSPCRPPIPPEPSLLATPSFCCCICQQPLYRQEGRNCTKAWGNKRKSLFMSVNTEECLCTKQRTCLLDYVYELDNLVRRRRKRVRGGNLAEPREDVEWVVTRSPFGASAHQNKACEQCLLGKRVCGLWSCDKRHLSPTDRATHRPDTQLCSVRCCLFNTENTQVSQCKLSFSNAEV